MSQVLDPHKKPVNIGRKYTRNDGKTTHTPKGNLKLGSTEFNKMIRNINRRLAGRGRIELQLAAIRIHRQLDVRKNADNSHEARRMIALDRAARIEERQRDFDQRTVSWFHPKADDVVAKIYNAIK